MNCTGGGADGAVGKQLIDHLIMLGSLQEMGVKNTVEKMSKGLYRHLI